MCCKYCGHGSVLITPSSSVGLIDLYKMLGPPPFQCCFFSLGGFI